MEYKPEESLGYITARASQAMANLLNANFAAAGYDFTVKEWAILWQLWQKDGIKQQQLAYWACKDKTFITRVLDDLEERNIVVRTPDKLDRRQKNIFLTSKGRNLKDALIPIALKSNAEAAAGIDSKDLLTCITVLCQIHDNLNASKDPQEEQ